MPLDRVLHESGSEMAYAYFPTTAIVSLMYETEDGSPIELAVVGNEGIVGVELFLGGRSTPSRAVVRSAGQAFRLPARAIKDEFDQAGPVMHLLLRYTHALISQMAQTAVCNRHHSLEQRLCRWLLMGLDRVQGNELVRDARSDRQHARRTTRRRDRERIRAATARADQLRARPHRGVGSQRTGETRLRVLCGGQERVRAAVSRDVGDARAVARTALRLAIKRPHRTALPLLR